jgi:hypothetical protein
VVYKYDSGKAYGEGDLVLQAQYTGRVKDLELYAHDDPEAPIGHNRIDEQDGLYIQGTYGILPRWRAGLRYDVVGLINDVEYPNGVTDSFDASHRVSAMVDFSPSEFSRLRLQLSRGSYETATGDEEAWQVFLQWMISLGTHGAHKF